MKRNHFNKDINESESDTFTISPESEAAIKHVLFPGLTVPVRISGVKFNKEMGTFVVEKWDSFTFLLLNQLVGQHMAFTDESLNALTPAFFMHRVEKLKVSYERQVLVVDFGRMPFKGSKLLARIRNSGLMKAVTSV